VSDNGSWRTQSRPDPLGGGKNFLQEGGIRVPMVVAGPGIQAGSASDVPVISTDLLSTISELAGIDEPLPDEVEGTSFAPVLLNEGELPAGTDNLVRDFGPQGELFFHSPNNFAGNRVFRIPPMSAVVRDNWKLIKLWGENGAPDEVYLTDLNGVAMEPTRLDPGSSLNRAHRFPEIAAELEAALMGWLQGVDASLPYDVKEDIELAWDAAEPGANPHGWRSKTDVGYVLRETWSRAEGDAAPQRVEAAPYQPGLSRHAFSFDGGDRMTHKYFHVSDLISRRDTPNAGTADTDRSATFEFWVRLDDLDREQILFESGGAEQGLSVTLGDGDGDGSYNEVRFRAIGDDGQVLSVTTELDRFANPTRDFVHLVAVLNDAPDNRFAELYVNGAALARTDGAAGAEGSIRWDGYDSAALGGSAGADLGAASGGGNLPFIGGGLRGDIAAMRFFNHSISAESVHDHYNEVLDPVGLGVASKSGAVLTPQERPSDVSEGAFESDSILVMQERTDVLDEPLTLDHAVLPDGMETTLPAGTAFTSYLVHFDPLGDPDDLQTAAGQITFAQPILGLLVERASLGETDATLGSIGRYETDSQKRLPAALFQQDGHSLELLMTALAGQVAQLRVLTEPALLIPGDFNGDLVVDQGDLSLVLLHWGQDGALPPLGWTTNQPGGLIGQGQLDAVLLHWGDRAEALVSAAGPLPVPEPGTLVILLAALGAICLVRRISVPSR
jgi:hypothetical protein